jgi:hypothetical protein
MISSNKKRRRRSSKVFLQGKIVSLDGTVFIDVKVRDLNSTGAILRIPPNAKIPESFGLLIISDGTFRPVEKRWRKGERVVVRFSGEPPLVSPSTGRIGL